MDMNQYPTIDQLERERALVQAKLLALREFMLEVRSQEGDLFSWIAHQELYGDYPGKELGLTVSLNGEVWFREIGM